MRQHIIEAHGITKYFKTRVQFVFAWESAWLIKILLALRRREVRVTRALDHVDLRVEKGEIFGLVGPNGAGKTTLTKILCTLLTPDEGNATICGHDLLTEYHKIRRLVSVMCVGGWVAFDAFLSVRENLLFFTKLYGLDEKEALKRVDEVIDVVDLKDAADKSVWGLSHGMRHKLILAKGLTLRPEIFFFDEPTVGLDPSSASQVRKYIREDIQDNMGKTVFLTTHYMPEAEELCDRVAIMDKGRIVACDTPENLVRRLKGRRVLEIEASNISPSVKKEVEVLRNVEGVGVAIEDPITLGGSIRIHTEDIEEVTDAALALLRHHGCQVLFVDTVEPTLEDVFIELTGGLEHYG